MFGDAMKMGDGVAVKLECGHPYVKPGERCSLCGQVLPGQEETTQAASQPLEENQNEE